MSRLLLVAFFGAIALPLTVAAWVLYQSFEFARGIGVFARETSVVATATPFLEWNGRELPFWPCVSGAGAVGALMIYGFVCGLFRATKRY